MHLSIIDNILNPIHTQAIAAVVIPSNCAHTLSLFDDKQFVLMIDDYTTRSLETGRNEPGGIAGC